jgi:hypothetical protein
VTKPTAKELLKGEGHKSWAELIARVEKVLAVCTEAERAKVSQGIVSAGLILRLLNGEEL